MTLPFTLQSNNKSGILFVFQFSFFLYILLFYGFFAHEALAQAPPCYVNSTSSCKTAGSGDYCPSGQTQCQGTRNEDGTGGVCYVCGQSGGSGTCSPANQPATAPDGSDTTCGQLHQPPGVRCEDVSNNLAGCYGTGSDRCKYCVTPICTQPGTFAFQGQCIKFATCATEASNISQTIATGNSSITKNSDGSTGYYSAYDLINWYLNNNLIGTTPMNSDGTGSNTFTNLTPNTTYELKAEYYDREGDLQGIFCSPDSFTTLPSGGPGQLTCSLTASETTIDVGETVDWTFNSNPSEPGSGYTAYWRGTDNGVEINPASISPWPPSPWKQTYKYDKQGNYARYVEVKDSNGAVKCTTDTLSLFVNPQSCSNNPISVSPSQLNFAPGGAGQQVSVSGARGTVSWSSGNTSIARVSPTTGFSTTVSPGSAGTTSATATDVRSGGISCRASASVTVSSSSESPVCPGACADSDGNQLNPSQCSGTWSYTAGGGTNKSWDTSCNEQKNASFGWYCYICDPGGR